MSAIRPLWTQAGTSHHFRELPRTHLTRCPTDSPFRRRERRGDHCFGLLSASYITRVSARESRRSASRKFATRIYADLVNAYSMFKINGLPRKRIQVVHQGSINGPYILIYCDIVR